jgi:hypothetical protein
MCTGIIVSLSIRRLRWMGHVKRMPNQRIPNLVLFGELAEGKRKRGGPTLRYKDVCKESMTAIRIKPDTRESTADDRTAWRTGMAASDKNIANKSEDKRQKGHMNISQGPCLPCSYCVARVSDYSVTREHARSDLQLNGLPGKNVRLTVCKDENIFTELWYF